MNPKKLKQIKHRHRLTQRKLKRTAQQIAKTVPSVIESLNSFLDSFNNSIITLFNAKVNDDAWPSRFTEIKLPDRVKLKQRYRSRVPKPKPIQLPERPKLKQRRLPKMPQLSLIQLPDQPQLDLDNLEPWPELQLIKVPKPTVQSEVSVNQIDQLLAIFNTLDALTNHGKLLNPHDGIENKQIIHLQRDASYDVGEGAVNQIVYDSEFMIDEVEYETAVRIARNAVQAAAEESSGQGYLKILDKMHLDSRIVGQLLVGNSYYTNELSALQRDPSMRHPNTGNWLMINVQFGISDRARRELQSIRDAYMAQMAETERKSI